MHTSTTMSISLADRLLRAYVRERVFYIHNNPPPPLTSYIPVIQTPNTPFRKKRKILEIPPQYAPNSPSKNAHRKKTPKHRDKAVGKRKWNDSWRWPHGRYITQGSAWISITFRRTRSSFVTLCGHFERGSKIEVLPPPPSPCTHEFCIPRGCAHDFARTARRARDFPEREI